MKNYLPLIFIALNFISCSDKQEKTVNSTLEHPIKAENNILTEQPKKEFIQLVKLIDSSGYCWDSKGLAGPGKPAADSAKKMIDGFLFCQMRFEQTPLYLHRDPNEYVKGADYCALNPAPFKKCKSIWAYSYIKKGSVEKDKYSVVINGLIEEFDFDDPAAAAAALKEIDRKKSLVFYHTRSFCCSTVNSVFVFSTRGGFDAALKEFFDRFIKNEGAEVPHNIPCYEE